MSEALVNIDGLTLEFATPRGTVKALDSVRLEIKRGEILGLVGETGCGKSVTSRSIMGLLPSNAVVKSGSIRFGDIPDVLKLDKRKLLEIRGNEIAMIFQDPTRSLNPVMTIGDQISESFLFHRRSELADEATRLLGTKLSLRVRLERKFLREFSSHGRKSIGYRIASRVPYLDRFRSTLLRLAKNWAVGILKSVRISLPERRADQYPHEISGGMRQRSMIAMALACRPKLLIADEPTTSLDVTTQYQILELIKDLRSEFDATVLLVTHNFGVVAEVCDRVAVMYAGAIAEVGEKKDIFESPLHPYTRGLLEAIYEIGMDMEPKEIPGFVPNLVNPPSGCRFHPRCRYAEEICSRKTPQLLEVKSGHAVACFPVQREAGLGVD